MSEAARIVALVIEVSDLERSTKLYQQAFGLALEPAHDHAGADRWSSGRHAAMSWSEGAFFHFALYEARQDPTRRAQIGIRVADLETAHAAALAAGAELIHAPRKQPWGRSARYRDPDGNVVELTQPDR